MHDLIGIFYTQLGKWPPKTDCLRSWPGGHIQEWLWREREL